jgi:RNA polymerase sigma-70 factor (ECF subfamily)
VRDDDIAAFETIFRRYWEPLNRFAFRYVRSADEAEDIVQTVFGRIWRSRAEWHVVGSLQDYLYLATRNASRDRLERDAVARRWRERRVSELRATEDGAVAAWDGEVQCLLKTSEIEAAMERSLAELPAKRRRICELRFSGDLSYAEIASQLGISTKTVETQIARGLKFLRTRLAQLLE